MSRIDIIRLSIKVIDNFIFLRLITRKLLHAATFLSINMSKSARESYRRSRSRRHTRAHGCRTSNASDNTNTSTDSTSNKTEPKTLRNPRSNLATVHIFNKVTNRSVLQLINCKLTKFRLLF
ncbi:hypothetical protein D9M69_664200 [compost metagenome]